jgi:hypothetical protein
MMIKQSQIQDILDAMAEQIGKLLDGEAGQHPEQIATFTDDIHRLVQEYYHINPWFTDKYIKKSLKSITSGLRTGPNPELVNQTYSKDKTIAFIINPGSPFEGIGEVIFAVFCGFRCLVKLPADCKSLYESLFAYLALTYNGLSNSVEFFTDRLPSFDGVVGLNAFEGSGAVGYIDKWPNLLMYHKGCTVTMAGDETADQLKKVAEGICDFYGRSFFSIKSLVVPAGYDFTALFRIMEGHNDNSINHRYFNHYEYHKSLMLINGIHHFDNGFILLTSDKDQAGKTGVVTYSEFSPESKDEVIKPGFVFNPALCSDSDNQHIISGQLRPEEILFYNSAKLADYLSGL